MACAWHSRDGQTPDIAVVKAKLVLSNCLDLLDVQWDQAIRRLAARFDQALKAKGIQLVNHRAGPKKGLHRLDCAFFNLAASHLEQELEAPVRSIRAASLRESLC